MIPPTPIILIPLTPSHIPKTFSWISNPELRRLFLMRGEVSWDLHRAYFDRVLRDASQTWYAILYRGVHVGNCGYKTLDNKAGEYTLWIYIGDPSQRGKGIGRAATTVLIRNIFNNADAREIVIHVADYNLPAIAMYKALGFREIPLGEDETEWQGRGCRVVKMRLGK